MKCRKCGKKMEKRAKRSDDSYFCPFCGAQVKKIRRKALLRETTKDIKDYLTALDDEDLNKYTSTENK